VLSNLAKSDPLTPLAGAKLTIYNAAGAVSYTGVSDNTGVFSLTTSFTTSGSPPPTPVIDFTGWSAFVSCPGYQSVKVPLDRLDILLWAFTITLQPTLVAGD
jgi:hypothetical protein